MTLDWEDFNSGFVAVLGRPNVGKSALVNALVGTKVTIVSDKPNTTRTQVRGIITEDACQVVLVDTPGIHRPRSPLGARLNETASEAASDVDLVLVVVDATAPTGPGDRRVLESAAAECFVVVNKIDLVRPGELLKRLAELSDWNKAAYFPVSARTGKGVEELRREIMAKMPPGPPYYPAAMHADMTETEWIAELVREELLAIVRDELPHSIATAVTEVEGRYVRCEIFVERDSQKAIVVGHHGENLKRVGTIVRRSLPKGYYLDLAVKVAKDWQSQARYLDQFGI